MYKTYDVKDCTLANKCIKEIYLSLFFSLYFNNGIYAKSAILRRLEINSRFY